MHGHVLEVVKRRLELVNNRINRVMHVGKYIYIMVGGLRTQEITESFSSHLFLCFPSA
jgi:hypothetical protein